MTHPRRLLCGGHDECHFVGPSPRQTAVKLRGDEPT